MTQVEKSVHKIETLCQWGQEREDTYRSKPVSPDNSQENGMGRLERGPGWNNKDPYRRRRCRSGHREGGKEYWVEFKVRESSGVPRRKRCTRERTERQKTTYNISQSITE